MEGCLYILRNDSLPSGYLKIGQTERSPHDRARELSASTGVPSPFKVAHQVKVPDCQEAERLVHGRLAQYRVSANREFFNIDLEKAVIVVLEVAQKMWQREVDLLREKIPSAEAARDLAEKKFARLLASSRKRRWRRLSKEVRAWITNIILPIVAALWGILVWPLAKLVAISKAALEKRISDPVERKAVAFFAVFPLIFVALVWFGLFYPIETVVVALAIVTLSAITKMVETTSDSHQNGAVNMERNEIQQPSPSEPPSSLVSSPPIDGNS